MKVALIVLFAIICVLLVLLVLIQNDEGGGLGGLLSGAGSAAFGSHSASVLNKTTFVLVALFFITAFSIAFMNKKTNLVDGSQTTEIQTGAGIDASSVIDAVNDVKAESEPNAESSMGEAAN